MPGLRTGRHLLPPTHHRRTRPTLQPPAPPAMCPCNTARLFAQLHSAGRGSPRPLQFIRQRYRCLPLCLVSRQENRRRIGCGCFFHQAGQGPVQRLGRRGGRFPTDAACSACIRPCVPPGPASGLLLSFCISHPAPPLPSPRPPPALRRSPHLPRLKRRTQQVALGCWSPRALSTPAHAKGRCAVSSRCRRCAGGRGRAERGGGVAAVA